MNLTDPSILRPFLARHGIRAEKGLGQHFLCSSKVVDAMVAELEGYVGLLEIGPGPGVITSPLAARAERMIALEIDKRMAVALSESAPRAEVRQIDALKVDLADILTDLPEPRAIVSNLPYYITGPLIDRIEQARPFFSKAVLMMQKEVATKIVAKPGARERGALSVLLQSRFVIRPVCDVPGGAFMPPPKVESAVLSFTPRPGGLEGDHARRVVRMSFAQPRKTLLNNLVAGQLINREDAAGLLLSLGIQADIRPQFLTEDQWSELANALTNARSTGPNE